MIFVIMDNYDITGLDPKSAQEYVLAAVTTLKATENRRAELQNEFDMWAKRIGLAKEHGKEDLLAQAESRKAEVAADLAHIKAEEAELKGGVIRLKGQLKLILGAPELSGDADLLAAQLELMDDDRDDLADQFREEEANDALAQLKAEIEKEEQSQ
jgi:phage shock protein A